MAVYGTFAHSTYNRSGLYQSARRGDLSSLQSVVFQTSYNEATSGAFGVSSSVVASNPVFFEFPSGKVANANQLGSITGTGLDGSGQEVRIYTLALAEVTFLALFRLDITSFPVAAFPGLETLRLIDNSLTSLDLRTNTALQEVRVQRNDLTSLNVAGLTSLTNLQVFQNPLTSLDTSTNTALVQLFASSLPLQTLTLGSWVNNPSALVELTNSMTTATVFVDVVDQLLTLSNNPSGTLTATGAILPQSDVTKVGTLTSEGWNINAIAFLFAASKQGWGTAADLFDLTLTDQTGRSTILDIAGSPTVSLAGTDYLLTYDAQQGFFLRNGSRVIQHTSDFAEAVLSFYLSVELGNGAAVDNTYTDAPVTLTVAAATASATGNQN